MRHKENEQLKLIIKEKIEGKQDIGRKEIVAREHKEIDQYQWK